MIALANRAEGGVRRTMILRAELTADPVGSAAGKVSVKIACLPTAGQERRAK